MSALTLVVIDGAATAADFVSMFGIVHKTRARAIIATMAQSQGEGRCRPSPAAPTDQPARSGDRLSWPTYIPIAIS